MRSSGDRQLSNSDQKKVSLRVNFNDDVVIQRPSDARLCSVDMPINVRDIAPTFFSRCSSSVLEGKRSYRLFYQSRTFTRTKDGKRCAAANDGVLKVWSWYWSSNTTTTSHTSMGQTCSMLARSVQRPSRKRRWKIVLFVLARTRKDTRTILHAMPPYATSPLEDRLEITKQLTKTCRLLKTSNTTVIVGELCNDSIRAGDLLRQRGQRQFALQIRQRAVLSDRKRCHIRRDDLCKRIHTFVAIHSQQPNVHSLTKSIRSLIFRLPSRYLVHQSIRY